MSIDIQKTFVFTMDDLIYESYKTLTSKNKVNKKSKKFKNYHDSKIKNKQNLFTNLVIMLMHHILIEFVILNIMERKIEYYLFL